MFKRVSTSRFDFLEGRFGSEPFSPFLFFSFFSLDSESDPGSPSDSTSGSSSNSDFFGFPLLTSFFSRSSFLFSSFLRVFLFHLSFPSWACSLSRVYFLLSDSPFLRSYELSLLLMLPSFLCLLCRQANRFRWQERSHSGFE